MGLGAVDDADVLLERDQRVPTSRQLEAREAQRAEVDAEGTVMDEAYFARQVQREIEAVNAWRATLADTKRMVEAGTLLEGTTRASMDSLILVKRAEWAQQIAATE